MVKFLRSDVERCKFEEFIKAFDADRMRPQTLRGFMGKCLFALEGYDDDPRELAMIPDARAFYRALYPAWPHWFFFSMLDEAMLKGMVLCYLGPTLQLQRDACPNQQTFYTDEGDLEQFLFNALLDMNSLWCKAGLAPTAFQDRQREIYRLFGMSPPSHFGGRGV